MDRSPESINFEWTASDGKVIRGRHWTHSRPRQVIILVHGFGEHIGRYEKVAGYLHQSFQCAVLGSDRRGHGRSDGPRGHFLRLEHLLEEIDMGLRLAREHYPGIPVFLYGHSMGGMLVLSHATRRKESGISGIISTAPWIRLAFDPPRWRIRLAYLAYKVWPGIPQPSGMDTSGLCTDPKVVADYENDPLVHGTITPGTVVRMFEEGKRLDNYRGGLPVPTLIMHGLADRITSVPHSRAFTVRNRNCEFKGWPGLYHEIHHEPNWMEVMDYASIWMERTLAD